MNGPASHAGRRRRKHILKYSSLTDDLTDAASGQQCDGSGGMHQQGCDSAHALTRGCADDVMLEAEGFSDFPTTSMIELLSLARIKVSSMRRKSGPCLRKLEPIFFLCHGVRAQPLVQHEYERDSSAFSLAL